MFVLPFFQWLIPREQSYDCCRQSEEEDEEDEGEQQHLVRTSNHNILRPYRRVFFALIEKPFALFVHRHLYLLSTYTHPVSVLIPLP